MATIGWLSLLDFNADSRAGKIWPVWVSDTRIAVFWCVDDEGGSLLTQHFDIVGNALVADGSPLVLATGLVDEVLAPYVTKVETAPSGFLVSIDFAGSE